MAYPLACHWADNSIVQLPGVLKSTCRLIHSEQEQHACFLPASWQYPDVSMELSHVAAEPLQLTGHEPDSGSVLTLSAVLRHQFANTAVLRLPYKLEQLTAHITIAHKHAYHSQITGQL